jgi:hypothetical protein
MVSNFHDAALADQAATCPDTGKVWNVGDLVIAKAPGGAVFLYGIEAFRTVRGEIFADVSRDLILTGGKLRRTDKLCDLVAATEE